MSINRVDPTAARRLADQSDTLILDVRRREALLRHRQHEPELPEARFAITTGPVLIGYVGTRMRRTPAFMGPCVNAAARILRLAEPGGIAATSQVIDQGRRVAPQLAGDFRRLEVPQALKGWQEPVEIFTA